MGKPVFSLLRSLDQSCQGRPTLAHGFNRGWRMETSASPAGAKETRGQSKRFLLSLTGLIYYRHAPSDESLGYHRTPLRDLHWLMRPLESLGLEEADGTTQREMTRKTKDVHSTGFHPGGEGILHVR